MIAAACTPPAEPPAEPPAAPEFAGPFEVASTFDVMASNGSAVAEIIDVSSDGKQLAYTDATNESIGFVDITNPDEPVGQGTLPVGGEPTSLVILNQYAVAGVNTSASFVEPSGKLVVVNRYEQRIVREIELGGQPDSVALAPDHKRVVVVLENERDEDLNDGFIPQNQTGEVLVVKIADTVKEWSVSDVDLSSVAASAFAGSDLEPEFVDINSENEAVVTFQENNHIAVIDLQTGAVTSEFSAGSVDLENIDTVEDDDINLDGTLTKRREPDSVAWIDNDTFVTANEGDYTDADDTEGGSRGFTLFNQDGTVEYESGASFEHWITSAGQYNESRSENKGVEPEAVEFGQFGSTALLFVGSERSNAVGVYDVTTGMPVPLQLLPTGIGPEGLKAIPQRNLMVASTETDEADAGIPTMINIYRSTEAAPAYPSIVSADDEAGNPVPWVALSGLAMDPANADQLFAVSDSFLAQGYIYPIDVSATPAVITERIAVTGASFGTDLEGIAVGPDGHFWLANEGDAAEIPNAIIETDADGVVLQEIQLPAELDEPRSNGFEGLSVVGTPETGVTHVYVAIQRAWPAEGDTDGLNTKIGRYDVETGEWTFVLYPLEPLAAGGWIGLSELSPLPNGTFGVIERDKGWGPTTGLNAELKSVFAIDLANAEFLPYQDGVADGGLNTISKLPLKNLTDDLANASIWTPEKLEGLAVSSDGTAYVVTDNDGVDGAPGETVFMNLGEWTLGLS